MSETIGGETLSRHERSAPLALLDPPRRSVVSQTEVRSVSSRDLMADHRLLLIQHGADTYRLQITRGGKLILTK